MAKLSPSPLCLLFVLQIILGASKISSTDGIVRQGEANGIKNSPMTLRQQVPSVSAAASRLHHELRICTSDVCCTTIRSLDYNTDVLHGPPIWIMTPWNHHETGLQLRFGNGTRALLGYLQTCTTESTPSPTTTEPLATTCPNMDLSRPTSST